MAEEEVEKKVFIDFENIKELEDSDSGSSFTDNLDKIYEKQKKTQSKLNKRPISSYTAKRNFNKKEYEMNVKLPKQKPQSAHQKNLKKNSTAKEEKDKKDLNNNNLKDRYNNNNEEDDKEDSVNYQEILDDINNYLTQKKITKNDFIENDNIFLNFSEFKDCFREINYKINTKYLEILFKSECKDNDEYILIKNFLKKLKFYQTEGMTFSSDFNYSESNKSERMMPISSSGLNKITESENEIYLNNENIENIYNENNNNNLIFSKDKQQRQRAANEIYEMNYINSEYKKFNDDILKILKNDKERTNQSYLMNYSTNLTKSRTFRFNRKFNKTSIESLPGNQKYEFYPCETGSKVNSNKTNKTNNKFTTETDQKKSASKYQIFDRKILHNISQGSIKTNLKPNFKDTLLENKKLPSEKDSNIISTNKKTENKNEKQTMFELRDLKKESALENEKIREQINKRKMALWKDCVYKMEECNKIAEIVNEPQRYFFDLNEGDPQIWIVYNHNNKKNYKLKQLLVEWRRLYKKYNNLQEKENQRISLLKSEEQAKKSEEVIQNEKMAERGKKYKNIKYVLTMALKMKNKLSEQYDNLKSLLS